MKKKKKISQYGTKVSRTKLWQEFRKIGFQKNAPNTIKRYFLPLFLILLFTGFWVYPQVIRASPSTITTNASLSISGDFRQTDLTTGTCYIHVAGLCTDWTDYSTCAEAGSSSFPCSDTYNLGSWGNGQYSVFYGPNFTPSTYVFEPVYSSDGIWSLVNLGLIPSICNSQTTETDCTFYPSCEWSGTTGACYYNSSTALTIPTDTCSEFDYACKVKNYFTWFFTDSPAQIGSGLNSVYLNFFQMFPIGYITRFKSLLLDDTLTPALEPPAISYTPGTSITDHTSIFGTFTFQPFNHMDITNTITEDTNGGTRNVWDIFMPYWNTMVYLSLGIVILIKLLNLGTDYYQEQMENGEGPMANRIEPAPKYYKVKK